jgi:hypothetical protein
MAMASQIVAIAQYRRGVGRLRSGYRIVHAASMSPR